MDPPRHLTSWAVRSLAGEPVSVVRVRNLQAVVEAGQDAWGRTGKPQPLLISVEVSFRHASVWASAEDRVAADTVHYGTLSKAILRSIKDLASPVAAGAHESLPSSRMVLDTIWKTLTGLNIEGQPDTLGHGKEHFLDLSIVRFLSVTITFPKASLLGQGVSLTAASLFGLQGLTPFVEGYATTLRLHGLRVPTLVGVNSNERNAKQVVVADIELDKVCPFNDVYATLEQVAVQTMEESSFETLEALGVRMGSKILTSFRSLTEGSGDLFTPPPDWQVRICLGKPTAVPFADCPVVEMVMREND